MSKAIKTIGKAASAAAIAFVLVYLVISLVLLLMSDYQHNGSQALLRAGGAVVMATVVVRVVGRVRSSRNG